mmetsp:Transcript_30421/g.64185  ORF Transcript_30421/g.64185 Transcript_30421/m.64185 type:complete len:235 (-) Transcript_30421:583-1287(-)
MLVRINTPCNLANIIEPLLTLTPRQINRRGQFFDCFVQFDPRILGTLFLPLVGDDGANIFRQAVGGSGARRGRGCRCRGRCRCDGRRRRRGLSGPSGRRRRATRHHSPSRKPLDVRRRRRHARHPVIAPESELAPLSHRVSEGPLGLGMRRRVQRRQVSGLGLGGGGLRCRGRGGGGGVVGMAGGIEVRRREVRRSRDARNDGEAGKDARCGDFGRAGGSWYCSWFWWYDDWRG